MPSAANADTAESAVADLVARLGDLSVVELLEVRRRVDAALELGRLGPDDVAVVVARSSARGT